MRWWGRWWSLIVTFVTGVASLKLALLETWNSSEPLPFRVSWRWISEASHWFSEQVCHWEGKHNIEHYGNNHELIQLYSWKQQPERDSYYTLDTRRRRQQLWRTMNLISSYSTRQLIAKNKTTYNKESPSVTQIHYTLPGFNKLTFKYLRSYNSDVAELHVDKYKIKDNWKPNILCHLIFLLDLHKKVQTYRVNLTSSGSIQSKNDITPSSTPFAAFLDQYFPFCFPIRGTATVQMTLYPETRKFCQLTRRHKTSDACDGEGWAAASPGHGVPGYNHQGAQDPSDTIPSDSPVFFHCLHTSKTLIFQHYQLISMWGQSINLNRTQHSTLFFFTFTHIKNTFLASPC